MIKVSLLLFTLVCSKHALSISDQDKVYGINKEAVRLFKETHYVTTEDGYILTIHRMPGPPGSTPVYFQHGIFESSGSFAVSGTLSLPYFLLERKYDIWLGNRRGNTFSKKHKTLNTSDPEFWNFSWSESGYYDIPAVVTYISNLKNDSLFYIGHSMGATDFSVMSIERPEFAKKIKAFIGLAPATYLHGNRSPFELPAPYWRGLQKFFNFFGIQEVLGRNYFFDFAANYICSVTLFRSVCGYALFVFNGWSPEQLNYDLLPEIISELPAGTSAKLFTHFLQQVNLNEFRKFDYGETGNLEHYNSSVPPLYDLTKIDVPCALFYSNNDYIISEQNTLDFYKPLRHKLGIYRYETLGHIDFLYGKEAPKLVYPIISDIFSNVLKAQAETTGSL